MKRLDFNLTDILYIGLGGMLGSLLRWFAGIGFEGIIPVPTIFVNVSGAVALGILYASQHQLHLRGKYLYMVGFCGSFTTVSLFSHETVQLILADKWGTAAINILLPILLSLAAVAAIIPAVEKASDRRHS